MLRDNLTNWVRHSATAACAAALLSGCAQTREFLTGTSMSDAPPEDIGILGAPVAEHYLDELYKLASGDLATQAEIFADAQAGAQLTPGPQTNLRYALVLATPGHSESDPELAQSMLREVLARTELLTLGEIALATVHLNAAEKLAVSESETRRLRASTSREAQTQELATNQRLATVEAENRRLQRELDEAQEKLDAITSIEVSIREQE